VRLSLHILVCFPYRVFCSSWNAAVQITTTKAQLKLNELQIRPYVKYIPTFFEAKREINVDMQLENLSPVPASVIYTELTPWIDGTTSGLNLHSTTEDVLYQHKGGVSHLPPITGDTAEQLMNSDSVLQIGICAIYAPLSRSDSRRWEMISLYEHVAGSAIPKTIYVEEIDVTASKNRCSSNEVRDRWLKVRSTSHPR
jgi:hypothetical protein